MNNRFTILTILASLFQTVCVLALLLGLVIAFDMQDAARNSNDALAQIPERLRAVLGLGLAFYALTGLVFSGGIHVLISINDKTHAASQVLATALAKLEGAPVVGARMKQVASRDKGLADNACPHCGAANNSHSRFCEVCGTAQPAS